MIFKTPWFFVLLLILPFLYQIMVLAERKTQAALKALRGSNPDQPKPGKVRILLKLGLVLMLIIALTQPAWNPHPIPAGVKGRDLVFAIDISRSMLAEDIYPNRLEVARFSVLEALGSMKGQRVGLITFAGSSSVRVPLTLDHNFVRYILKSISPSDADVGSTSLQAAIEEAVDIVLDESERGKQDLIIFTDGEDHISNVDKVVEELRDWGARVLIIGLGDPVEGARIPSIGGEQPWMSYKGSEVVSRLDEKTLNKLADESPGITFYPARTNPFDLLSLYHEMLVTTGDLELADETQVVYDEGYMYFIALALLLLILSFKRKLNITFVLLIFLYGCAQKSDLSDAEYQQRFEQGRTLWSQAQSALESSPQSALEMLDAARESFLLAAMFRPGDLASAEQIAGVSAQMREVEKIVEKIQKEEQDLQQQMQAAVELLRELTKKERALSDQGRNLMRHRPPAPANRKKEVASSVCQKQKKITISTRDVLETVQQMQTKVRDMLESAFDNQVAPATTEFDEVTILLQAAGRSQRTVESVLFPPKTDWADANSSLTTASRKMQEALDVLSDQSGDQTGEQDSEAGDMEDWDYDEDMEWSESSADASMSMPIRSQNFNSALNSRNLPVPNFSAEEILAEEENNQLKRDQQNSSRAGAKVDKNW